MKSKIQTTAVLFFAFAGLKAQVFNFTISPSVTCLPAAGTVTVQAVQTASSAGAATYGWNVVPATASVMATWTAATPSGTSVVITFSTCGTYSIYHYAYPPGNPVPINTVVRAYTVNCLPAPIVSIVIPNGTATVCAGTPVNLSAAGATSYSWSTGSTNPNITVSPSVTTVYAVTGTGNSGCQASASATISVSNCVVLGEQGDVENLTIYPNPASSSLYIKNISGNKAEVQLMDISGRVVFSSSVWQTSEVDLRNLSNGTYILTCITGNKISHSKVVIDR